MNYETRQYGKAFLVMVFFLLVIVTGVLTASGEVLPALVISVMQVILMACFSWLTVSVHREGIKLSFGIGLVRRTIPYERIASTSIVRNKWWYGWGIRLTPHGWMWNLSGLDAVELLYHDGKSFRIGSEDPKGLKRAIDTKLD
jgi:hypothetical protein